MIAPSQGASTPAVDAVLGALERLTGDLRRRTEEAERRAEAAEKRAELEGEARRDAERRAVLAEQGAQDALRRAEAIEAAAKAAGLAYYSIPLGREGVSPDMVEKTREALEGSAGPVFCYCRSGTRSTTLWALSQAGSMPGEEIISAAQGAGYDMSHLAAHLGQK